MSKKHYIVKPTDPMTAGVITDRSERGDVVRNSPGMPLHLEIAICLFNGYTSLHDNDGEVRNYAKYALKHARILIEEYNAQFDESHEPED